MNENLNNTNFWPHDNIFCLTCGGEGQFEVPFESWVECKDCAGTGLEPIPFTELFPNLRRGEPEKYPL